MERRKRLSIEGVYKNILSTPQIGDRVRVKKGHVWSKEKSSVLRTALLCLRWYIRAGCYGTIVRQSFFPNHFSVQLDYIYSSQLGEFLPCYRDEVTIIG
jgi:hypothetical protein